MNSNRFLILALFLIINTINLGQLKISQLPSGIDNLEDPLFLGLSSTRTIQNLNGNWKVYFEEEPDNFSSISFPATFTSQNSVVFEKSFKISSDKVFRNYIELNFLGLNYTAEVFLNNEALYKHPGGEIPFTIDIPENLINFETKNTLQIKIQYNIDSENTIPLLQRFLFPTNFGGIFRDVYLKFRPKIGIKNVKHFVVDEKKPYKKRIDFDISLENFTEIFNDSLFNNFDNRFKIEAIVKISNDTNNIYYNIFNIDPIKKNSFNKSFFVKLKKIYSWTPKAPIFYTINLKLTDGNGFVYDELVQNIEFIDLLKNKGKLKLNNQDFTINGVGYIRSDIKSISDYKKIEEDIKVIKECGFNTVRFSKTFPHPYAVYMCNKLGLFSLIELPLNSVPERISQSNNFRERAQSFILRAIKYYDRFNNVIAYGSGGSYLNNSDKHLDFISTLSNSIKNNTKKFTYTSFWSNKEIQNTNVDLYGIEIYGSFPESFTLSNTNDSTIYFISEAIYPTYKGATNGYLNKFSFEGQANFIDNIINVAQEQKLNGFVLSSMFDYSGDYAPLFSGFNKNNNYNLGIVPSKELNSRISVNLIKSKLVSSSKISIPIGNNEEEAPLFFIITALIISVIIALLINSKRKFREDATRALLRPYNFFADIRDQRILSGFHSNTLLLLLAGINALLFTILLYFLKDDIITEKIINAFGNYKLTATMSYLAWHPEKAFMYIYAATISLFVLISFFVHLSSFFVKTRVLFSSVFSVAIWAFLPMALLLPIEAVLYKILLTLEYNQYVYIFLLAFFIWNIQRFLKGIYVIFDIRPLYVYFYSFFVIIILLLSVGFYFQYSISVFDYISLAIKQYSLL